MYRPSESITHLRERFTPQYSKQQKPSEVVERDCQEGEELDPAGGWRCGVVRREDVLRPVLLLTGLGYEYHNW